MKLNRIFRKSEPEPLVIVEQVVGVYVPRTEVYELDPIISACTHRDEIWDDETATCSGCGLTFRQAG